MPPTPWQTEIRASGDRGGGDAVHLAPAFLQRIHAVHAGMHVKRPPPLVLSGSLPPGAVSALGNKSSGLAARDEANLRGHRSADAKSLPPGSEQGRRR
jgi:hypothetical protein